MAKEGGGLPRFQIKPDVDQTMAEMMQALMGRVPRGTGNGGVGGAGSGSGGSGGDGFSVAGNSTHIPLYGPDRLAFSQSTGMAGRGGGKSRGGKRPAGQQVSNRVKPTDQVESDNTKFLSENVPAKYKSAVKRYFSDVEGEEN